VTLTETVTLIVTLTETVTETVTKTVTDTMTETLTETMTDTMTVLQVDTGLTYQSGRVSYQFMFDIKTPKRVYYLAADSEPDMTAWVDWVCQVITLSKCVPPPPCAGVRPPDLHCRGGPHVLPGGRQGPKARSVTYLKRGPV
jgi:hypothetical protein